MESLWPLDLAIFLLAAVWFIRYCHLDIAQLYRWTQIVRPEGCSMLQTQQAHQLRAGLLAISHDPQKASHLAGDLVGNLVGDLVGNPNRLRIHITNGHQRIPDCLQNKLDELA